MSIKVGINGFGRIGRLALRAAWDWPELEFVRINDPAGDAATHAHLLNFDSVHGRWQHEAGSNAEQVLIEGKAITVTANRALADTDWSDCDLVIEASGKMKTLASLQPYLDQGVKRVVACAPIKEPGALNVVMGVNQDRFDPQQHRIVTAASCTTNCLAPMVAVLDQAFTVRQGLMTTIHSYTNDQNLVDKAHGDLLRARAAAVNMIPTSTGAAKAVGLVLPHLQGRLDGLAVRVPTLNVSLVDFTVTLEQVESLEQVHEALSNAAHSHLQGVLAVNHLPLVSSDFNHLPYSCVVDTNHSRLLGQQLKLLAWYDNEWGFSHRMLDVAAYWMDA